jgi:hypothetical protein
MGFLAGRAGGRRSATEAARKSGEAARKVSMEAFGGDDGPEKLALAHSS